MHEIHEYQVHWMTFIALFHGSTRKIVRDVLKVTWLQIFAERHLRRVKLALVNLFAISLIGRNTQ